MTTPILIGIGGRLRAGKDAIAEYLANEHGFVVLGMSDALRDHSAILNPFIRVVPADGVALEPGFYRVRALLEKLGYTEAKKVQDYRAFLQADGTPGGRDFHHENVWTDRVGRMVDMELKAGHSVALTGLRFINEINLVRAFAGRAVWVERPGLDSAAPTSTHVSETSVDGTLFDTTIVNDGSLEDLYQSVERHLKGLHA